MSWLVVLLYESAVLLSCDTRDVITPAVRYPPYRCGVIAAVLVLVSYIILCCLYVTLRRYHVLREPASLSALLLVLLCCWFMFTRRPTGLLHSSSPTERDER